MNKLNLGSGKDYKEGFINIDNSKEVNPDLHYDLNKRFPFKSNTIDLILCKAILEHIDNPLKFMKDCHRVLKPNGKFIFRVPLANTLAASGDMQHKNFFTPNSFKERHYYGYESKKRKINVTLPLLHIRCPAWLVYINKFLEIFTGIEGELIK